MKVEAKHSQLRATLSHAPLVEIFPRELISAKGLACYFDRS
jgi:cell fate (sporulation/competence/biofilm development) regulator YmcA (YheA/YmcA/DUF963 family)